MTEAAASGGQIRIGMIGYAFMGRMHSHAWLSAARLFELPLQPELHTICGRDPTAVKAVAEQFAYANTASDWADVIANDEIDAVIICVPGNLHADITIAALEAGKHVLCEKPLANNPVEAEAMRAAADAAAPRGVRAAVGFNYRHLPAVRLARQMIQQGLIGQPRLTRTQFLQDWLSDAETPISWRLDKDSAGSGALGDLGSHAIDIIQYLIENPISAVSGLMQTAISERPIPDARRAGSRGPVTVDDTVAFTAQFRSGTLGTFEASRVATGRKAAFAFEIYGSEGSVKFDFEDLNHLYHYQHDDPYPGFRKINVTGGSYPYARGWWPAGHSLGYDAGFIHQNVEFTNLIAGNPVTGLATFEEGLQVQQVLAAVERSAANEGVLESVKKDST